MPGEPLNIERAAHQLARHEGFEPVPYRCTEKKLTIAHGYNIDARGLAPLSAAIGRPVTLPELYATGLTKAEAHRALVADILELDRKIPAKFPLYLRLDEVRKRVVVDFVYNLGGTGALAFKTAIDRVALALEQTTPRLRQACWDAAAFHLMDSLWADQVDDGLRGRYGRADRLCGMLRTGRDFTR